MKHVTTSPDPARPSVRREGGYRITTLGTLSVRAATTKAPKERPSKGRKRSAKKSESAPESVAFEGPILPTPEPFEPFDDSKAEERHFWDAGPVDEPAAD